jgi:hypothetical protein
MQRAKELVLKGMSMRDALIEAGYSKNVANAHSAWYLERLDLKEVIQGIKARTAVLGLKALKTLEETLDAEKDADRIKSADVVARFARTYHGQPESQTLIRFQFQTISKDLYDEVQKAQPEMREVEQAQVVEYEEVESEESKSEKPKESLPQ